MGGGGVFGGAITLCTHVLLSVVMSLCASQVILGTLNMSSCNVCKLINNVIILFDFLGMAVDKTASHFLAIRLTGGSPQRLRRAFGATFVLRVKVTVVILFLTRAIKL